MAQSYKSHQNGRPTKTTQLQIQKEIRKYFELGISATVAASKTGINIKTVCKYYEEWYEQIREVESNDFLERQKNERTQIIVTFDEQILLVHEQLDEVDNQIKKYRHENKPIPRHLLSLKLEISKFISSLIEKKGFFMMKPIMEEGLKNKIRSMREEHAKT